MTDKTEHAGLPFKKAKRAAIIKRLAEKDKPNDR